MPRRRRLLCGAGSLGIAALAGCFGDDPAYRATRGTDADTEWPQPGGRDRFDCYRPDAAAPVEEPGERWVAETGFPAARPVVADGRVLAYAGEGLSAFDLGTGEARWRLDADGGLEVRAAPAVVGGVAYVAGGQPRSVAAIDVADGDLLWTVELEAPPTVSPVVGPDRETVVVGTAAGLVGVDADGERLWRRETYAPVSALASSGDRLRAGTEGGRLLALSGHREPQGSWRRQVDGTVTRVALLDGDGTVLSVAGGPVERRDGSSAGAVRWSHGGVGGDGLVVARNTYALGGGDVASVHTRTGERHWRLGDGFLDAAPAAAGDTLYTGGSTVDGAADGKGFVAAYDLTGGLGVGDHRIRARRWRYDVAGRNVVGVSVADGAVFAVTRGSVDGSGFVYALE